MPSAKTFFTDRPIAYHPILAKVCGSVTAALFLSQLAYWSDKGASRDGWIWKTREEMEDETGLSRSEQETARKKLIALGILQEERRGVPARMWYLINWDVLTNLIDQFEQSRLQDSRKLDCEKPANYSEITTETTTEILSQSDAHPSEYDQTVATIEKEYFTTTGGTLSGTFYQKFKPIYDTNADHRAERLQYALQKMRDKRNFFSILDGYMQWKPPELKPQYPQKREQFNRPPVRSTLPIRTD